MKIEFNKIQDFLSLSHGVTGEVFVQGQLRFKYERKLKVINKNKFQILGVYKDISTGATAVAVTVEVDNFALSSYSIERPILSRRTTVKKYAGGLFEKIIREEGSNHIYKLEWGRGVVHLPF